MAGEKTASVKITGDPQGFIAGLKQAEKAGEQAGAKIESSLSKAAKAAARDFIAAAKQMVEMGRSANGQFTGGMGKIREMAKTIKDAYKEAYREAVKFEQLKAQRAKEFAKEQAGRRKESFDTLKTAGGYALGGAVALSGKAVVDANKVLDKATRISIGARGAGAEGVDPQQLMREFFAITQDIKGVTADQLADGTAKFVAMTGDLSTARSSLKDFATVAMASGASVEDVAGTAAAISQQFGITDPGQIKDVLASLVFQGKAGAFELKDAAGLFPRLAAAGASFGLDKGTGGVKTLGGLVQIARSGTGSGEQAATAVESMLTRLKTEATKLEAQGVKVYDKGKVRDLPSILIDSIAKLGGKDIKQKNAKLAETFGEQGIRAINPLVTQYQDAFAKSKGKTDNERQADAMEQLRQKILESVNAAGDWSEVVKDAATASSTSSAKMTSTWEGFTGQVSEKVLPKVAQLGDKALKAGGAFDALATTLSIVVDMANFVADQFLWIGRQLAGPDEAAQLTSQYNMEVGTRDKARADLQDMQMRPEEIAAMQKSDPEKLAQLRARAKTLKATADQYDQRADATWEKLSKTETGAGMDARVRSKVGNGASATPPPVKATLDTAGKTLDVRVTNAKDIGGAPPAAPRPGYVPPP